MTSIVTCVFKGGDYDFYSYMHLVKGEIMTSIVTCICLRGRL